MIQAFEVCNGSKTETQIDYFVRIKAESITLAWIEWLFSICLTLSYIVFRYEGVFGVSNDVIQISAATLQFALSATLLCYFCIQRIPRLEECIA